MNQGPQQVHKAAVTMEESAMELIQFAVQLTDEAYSWESAALLKKARIYAAAVQRLTRVRKRQ